MIFNATSIIAEKFDTHDIKYRIVELEQASIIEAGYQIECGPAVVVKFISRDEDNDVAIRLYNLVHHVPDNKKARIQEVCNELNNKVRFYKFNIDDDNDVNAEYDLMVSVTDECVGEIAVEAFARIMHILDEEYCHFMEALYSPEDKGPDVVDILKHLKELREMGPVATVEGTDVDYREAT